MKLSERTSIIRVLIDLIKADSVIDEGEMALYAKIKEEYNITREDELAASSMTLAEAVAQLSESTAKLRADIMQIFSDMTISDGFCAPKEALLMIALHWCLSEETRGMSEMFSIHEPNVIIDDNQVIYVESAYDGDINKEIVENYRFIDRELRLIGFNFVYIPYIASHYKGTEKSLFYEISKFLAPNINEERIDSLVESLQNINTVQYCSEQLCNKLGMHKLLDLPPGLLIKVGNTYVGEKLHANFLRITIEENVLDLVQSIADRYSGMLSSDGRYIVNIEEAHGQFLYHGFYKQLFDTFVIQKGIRSSLLIDIPKGKFILPDLGMEIKGMHRKEKALYLLLIFESPRGGVCFSQSAGQTRKSFEKHMKNLMDNYRIVYGMMGGDKRNVPDLSFPEIRRPIISNIRKSIKKLESYLHNANDYSVSKDSFGYYKTNISYDMVNIQELSTNGKHVSFTNSLVFNKLSVK